MEVNNSLQQALQGQPVPENIQFWCPKLDKICTLYCCRQLLYSSFSFARNQKRAVCTQHAHSLGCLMHEVLLGNIQNSFLNISKMSFPSVISYRVLCQYQVFERPLKSIVLLYYSHSHNKWYCDAFGGGRNAPESSNFNLYFPPCPRKHTGKKSIFKFLLCAHCKWLGSALLIHTARLTGNVPVCCLQRWEQARREGKDTRLYWGHGAWIMYQMLPIIACFFSCKFCWHFFKVIFQRYPNEYKLFGL